jgi:hypothetical protein
MIYPFKVEKTKPYMLKELNSLPAQFSQGINGTKFWGSSKEIRYSPILAPSRSKQYLTTIA